MQSNDLSLSVVAGLVAFGLAAESGVTQAAAEPTTVTRSR